LIGRGEEVVCVDNFLTGQRSNIAHLEDNPNFSLIVQDASLPIHLERSVDAILHLASPASPVHYLRHPIETLKAGSLSTLNLLELAREQEAIFLLASTSEVYGDPKEHPQPEGYWGNVNPVGVRSCFSEDTEVLTAVGWKRFAQVVDHDEILTRDASHNLKYQIPTEIIKQRYIGELIRFLNRKVDLLVTPNHRMYVRQRGKRNFELIEAFHDIRWQRAEMAKAGTIWTGKKRRWVTLPLVKNAKTKQHVRISMELWLEFFGYFITDGCTYLRRRKQRIDGKWYNTPTYIVLISQSKKNASNREKIRACLERLGYRFYEENAQFRILSKQLYMCLVQFGKAKDKYIPRSYLSLPRRQLRVLFDAMMLGDGSRDKRTFFSSSPHLLGAMQELLLKLGMAGNLHRRDGQKGTYALYIVSDKKKDFLTPHYPRRVVEQYDGYVYCVNVPNHVIYVRRNGKALWCGNCYDEAKRFSEAATMAFHREHGVKTRIARIFNTYGPKMDREDGRAIPNFIAQALSGSPLTLYGDGSQTRSFCYITDLTAGLLQLLEADLTDPVNLGNATETTLKELAGMILKLSGSSSTISRKPLPQDDPKVRRPVLSTALKRLGWKPLVPLEDGLKETIAWFRKLPAA